MGKWGDGEMGRWGNGEMGRWGAEKTVSRKETEIHPLSWSIGYGEVSSPSHSTGSSEDQPLSFNWN
ncbi:MAG: isopentenyl pyrophosphate isomerase [Okeania sp. SIO2C9]|uniref:isopentenyl pyrophosphate isomerase n=1 Tax=Okeania sp. SIO2C9 TaxID=2607791 RepID=UPI0013BEFC73|nr:isopentenyl pyrophosphate isomerase [Okeania sp. SIO2C9]NEQ72667.1 isopentenyl pyrophosphate isomerase [Okeania sp. SIO2C9]